MSSNKRVSFKHLQSGGQLGRARSKMSNMNEIFMGGNKQTYQKVDQAILDRVMIRRRAMIITEINRRRRRARPKLESTRLLVKLNWNLIHSEDP